ncbi:hypothetical protein SDC9_156563 [bioreactor metagenome]|uniref:Uncharacterized protein n=1 Tax=bioreactor metagenome TaxID=1076179 RepID=A0A645F9M4_9ZZZZ
MAHRGEKEALGFVRVLSLLQCGQQLFPALEPLQQQLEQMGRATQEIDAGFGQIPARTVVNQAEGRAQHPVDEDARGEQRAAVPPDQLSSPFPQNFPSFDGGDVGQIDFTMGGQHAIP